MPKFTANQLKALVYNAVGRTSEVGGLPAYQLQIAANIVNGAFVPVGKSGYSLGVFQFDYGQHPKSNANALVQAYNAWAPASEQIVGKDQTTFISALISDGKQIAQNNLYLPLTDPHRLKLDKFFASGTGRNFIAKLDQQWFTQKLSGIAQQANNSLTVARMSKADVPQAIAAVVKVYNQNPTVGQALLRDMQNTAMTLTGITNKVITIVKKTYSSGVSGGIIASITSGMENAKTGARLYYQLETSKSRLGTMWRAQEASDPTLMQSLNANPSAPYFDLMFRKATFGLNAVNLNEKGVNHVMTGPLKHAPDETYFEGITSKGVPIILDSSTNKGWQYINGHWAPLDNSSGAFIHKDKNGHWHIAALTNPSSFYADNASAVADSLLTQTSAYWMVAG
ncbi:MAG TPA: hypothetical protein DEP05_00535, partial [Betaproteobacteria bacterium]|nr:hypothetical protein [Betaproteobacteria bacterium]